MVKDVPLKDILDNPFQPRTDFAPETIRSLAEEIKAEGFWSGTLQGRRTKNGKVELVFGHRRLRALRLLKTPSVKVEILDLTDAQMALRSLEENLQREGLTDLDKADSVRRAVELERASRRDSDHPERGAIQTIADRLGLSRGWVSELCDISSTIVDKERRVITAAGISARAALLAQEWGGKEYVHTLARQAKQAATDGVAKPTQTTVEGIRRAVTAAPEPLRTRLKHEVVSGKLRDPDDVASRARRLSAQHVKRTKEPPPDLRAVIVQWTHDLKDWDRKMRDVAPYMDYVDEVPAIADRFREALQQLIDTAKDLLKSSR